MRACTSINVNDTRCTGAMRGRARVHAGLFTKVHTNTIHFETGRALTAAHVWLHQRDSARPVCGTRSAARRSWGVRCSVGSHCHMHGATGSCCHCMLACSGE